LTDTKRGTPEEEYFQLKQQLEVLTDRRTRLETRLQVQREERVRLEETLAENGVDLARIEEEKVRLEQELQDHLTTAREAVGEFADELESALGQQTTHLITGAAIELT